MARTMFPATQGSGLRLGLGGAPLGNLFAALGDAQASALVESAWGGGCRCFDTAPHYGNGLSEHRLGQSLRTRARDTFVLSSKVGRLLTPASSAPREQFGYVDVLPFKQHWDYSSDGTRRSIEDSLQRLGLARIDVAYVHDIDAATHGAGAPRVLQQVLDDTLPTLLRLKEEGLVGSIGLGVNDWRVVMQVLQHADLDALMLAGRYSLLDHSALPELLPLCVQRGVQIALGGVFNSGILATGVRAGRDATFNYAPATREWTERTVVIEAVCDAFGVPLRAAALQFPLAHEAIGIVIVGPRSAEEWADCVEMMNCPIPAGFWCELRARRLIPQNAPTPL